MASHAPHFHYLAGTEKACLGILAGLRYLPGGPRLGLCLDPFIRVRASGWWVIPLSLVTGSG